MFGKNTVKLIFIFFSSVVILGCGVSSDGDTAKDRAIDKLVAYAGSNGTNTLPTLQDYLDAGVVGVDETKVAELNQVISNLSQEEVDTTEEVQALADALGVTVPEDAVAPNAGTTVTPTSSKPTTITTPNPPLTTPTTSILDTTPPVITINGANSISAVQFLNYVDAGATAIDDIDGNVTVTTIGSVDIDVVGSYDINYTATDRAGNSVSIMKIVTITKFSINDNTRGISYGAMRSLNTQRVWLDANLGAGRACVDLATDVDCRGNYYQWGRYSDGHEVSSSLINNIQSTFALYGNGNSFIIDNLDWTNADSSGSIRSIEWSKIDGSSICPIGFRVPTYNELLVEDMDFLKVPIAGYRESFQYLQGHIKKAHIFRLLWSNTPYNEPYHEVGAYANNDRFNQPVFRRSIGIPIRCIMD